MFYLLVLLSSLALGQDTDDPDSAYLHHGPHIDMDSDGVPDHAEVIIEHLNDCTADHDHAEDELTVDQRLDHVEAQGAKTQALLKALLAAAEEEAAAEEHEAAAEEFNAAEEDYSEKDDPEGGT
jgi:hypothetical protein